MVFIWIFSRQDSMKNFIKQTSSTFYAYILLKGEKKISHVLMLSMSCSSELPEAALHRCSCEKMFWKNTANL